jgi:deoxyadenosine/deoxycytidine kinase
MCIRDRSNESNDKYAVVFAPEPVSVWQTIKDKEGVTVLERFYQDQEQYAFPFQMMAYISRLAVLRKIIKERDPTKPLYIITERSLYTDKHIFAKMLYDQGKINEINYQIYLQWFDEFTEEIPVTHCVYLRSDPVVCHTRIAKRARAGEDIIPLEYLNDCHTYHDEYVTIYPDRIVLDANVDVYQQPDILTEWIDRFQQIINGDNKDDKVER